MKKHPPQRERRDGARRSRLAWLRLTVSYVTVSSVVSVSSVVMLFGAAQVPDWKAAGAEATRLLQEYVRIDTSNPPGDTRKTADFLASLFEREGIPVTRYESAPGKAIIYARLKATVTPAAGKAIMLLHHMDVVPADRSQWKVDPFAGAIVDGEMRARGAFDMKGVGVAHILAFLMLKRQHVPLARDVILLADPDEEVGGAMGARWMIANHFAELDPAFVLDEGAYGSRDLFAASWSTRSRWLKRSSSGSRCAREASPATAASRTARTRTIGWCARSRACSPSRRRDRRPPRQHPPRRR
jgi:hypothetical protein